MSSSSPPASAGIDSRRRFLVCAGTLGAYGLATRAFGAGDRLLPINDRMRAWMTDAPRKMEFTGSTREQGRAWQEAFHKQLASLLGDYRPPAAWESKLESAAEFPDHIREERLLTAPDREPLPIYFLRPAKNGAPVPGRQAGIVAVHGHGLGHDTIAGRAETPELQAELAKLKYDYGLQLVRRGYAVAVPCLTPFGRRLSANPALDRREACETTHLRMQLLGRSLLTENLRDVLWALSFLAQHEFVDADRLGCVGLSLGGRMTMFAAAMDSRIKVAVMAGSLNWLQERASTRSIGGCQVVPGLLQYGDVPEIAGLIAPRPILWTVGDADRLIDPEWAERAMVKIRRVYTAMNAPQAVSLQRFEGGHEWNGSVAYGLLERVLAPH